MPIFNERPLAFWLGGSLDYPRYTGNFVPPTEPLPPQRTQTATEVSDAAHAADAARYMVISDAAHAAFRNIVESPNTITRPRTAPEVRRDYAQAQAAANAISRQFLETMSLYDTGWQLAAYAGLDSCKLGSQWGTLWKDPHPISSTPKNGDDKMYVRPEVGTILAYNMNPDRPIADDHNRLFYVVSHSDSGESFVNLASLSDTDTYYAGYTHEGIRTDIGSPGSNFVTLDDAEKIRPGIKAYAKRFDRDNYTPSVGDKVLVTHKGVNTAPFGEGVYWVSEMDHMVGFTYTVTELVKEHPDRVQLNHTYWFDLKWVQPVALVDHKKKLRIQARSSLSVKHATWNSPYPIRSGRRKYHWGEKEGKALAELRGRAEKRDASEAVIAEYLHAVKDFSYGIQGRIEPASQATYDRFYNGIWERIGMVPSTVENALHCLHVSEEDKTKIAYYPTLRHFREAREVRTTLGKYLTKYKDLFGFDENACRTLAQKYIAMQTGEGYKLSFKEQDDPDGWVQVYNDGPHSCMKGEEAVAVYASGVSGLRLAYLEDVSGDIVARCIVRDSDDENLKGYVRVYPDPNGDPLGHRLLDLLTEAGYGNWTHTKGCLLAYKTTGYGEMICPYIDYGNGGSQYVDKVTRNGTMYLLVGAGDIEADRTDGLVAEEDNTCACGSCNEYFDEDDLTYVESDDRQVCESCMDEYYVYAYGRRSCPEWFDKDNCSYCESDGNWYHDDYLDNHNVALCEWRELYYKLDELVMTNRGLVHIEDCVELAVSDSDGNDWALEADTVRLSDGRYIHEDMAEQDFITGEWLLADEDEDGVIQVFTRQLISSNGTSALTHKWTTLEALANALDEWVVEFMPRFHQGKYVNALTCITWKGQEAQGSAVISFRDLTLDMIRSDETFEKIFEYMDEHGLIEAQEEAA